LTITQNGNTYMGILIVYIWKI